MEVVEVEGVTVAVREWGPPGGRPLVFWHALGPAASGAMAAEVAATLADAHGIRTIAVDAPGFGASPALPREGYDARGLARVLLGLVDRFELDRPLLMGHSWGGLIVELAAEARPDGVSGLVLLDAGHGDYQDAPGFPGDTSWEALLADASRPERRWRFADAEQLRAELADGLPRPVPDVLVDAMREGMRVDDGGALVGIPTPEVRAAAISSLCDVRASSTWNTIAGAGIPILLLLATVPAELREQNETFLRTFRDTFPSADVFFVERAGHGLLTDLPAEVARRIGDWLPRPS